MSIRSWLSEELRHLREAEADDPGPGVVLLLVIAAFVLFPLVQAVTSSGTAGHHAITIGGAIVFVGAYCLMILLPPWGYGPTRTLWQRGHLWALSTMFAMATALSVVEGPDWVYLFTYCAATSTLIANRRLAQAGIGLAAVLAAVVPLLQNQSTGTVLGNASGAVGVALIMMLLRDIGERNAELSRARSELARLAVASERERFARDLHDLLGHSLSVIALKADLAGRLLSADPDRAAAEVADIESVARQSLSEVREAVGGYRRPTLGGELEGARVALLAAGVGCEIDWDGTALDPEAESVLAWAVREGATNVIRHSAAHRCTLRVSAGESTQEVEVVDDGQAPVAVASSRGHGLAGLRERVALLEGDMAAGPLAGGGYRLAVSVPRGRGCCGP